MERQSIIETLKKILALREQGVDGEAAAAEALLQRMCNKYGISVDELLERDKTVQVCFKGVSDPHIRRLLFGCYYKVTNKSSLSYYKYGRAIIIELSPAEAIDLQELFSVMKKAFLKERKKQMSDLLDAFRLSNGLFSQGDGDSQSEQSLSPDELERLRRIAHLSMTIRPTAVPRRMIQNT